MARLMGFSELGDAGGGGVTPPRAAPGLFNEVLGQSGAFSITVAAIAAHTGVIKEVAVTGADPSRHLAAYYAKPGANPTTVAIVCDCSVIRPGVVAVSIVNPYAVATVAFTLTGYIQLVGTINVR